MLRSVCQVVLLAAATLSLQAANPPDFSGKWELNLNKSDFGDAPKPARMTIDCTVSGNEMRSVTTTYVQQDNSVNESIWYLDGKKHPTDRPVPGYSMTRWQDGVLINERGSNDGAYKEVIRLTLSVDGKTATETVQTKTPNGNNKEKLIWERK